MFSRCNIKVIQPSVLGSPAKSFPFGNQSATKNYHTNRHPFQKTHVNTLKSIIPKQKNRQQRNHSSNTSSFGNSNILIEASKTTKNSSSNYFLMILAALAGFAMNTSQQTEAEDNKKDVPTNETKEDSVEKLRPFIIEANTETKKKEGKAPIYRIVLTGGPCGGKTTALSQVADRLRSLGFRVFVVPEAATIVITGGGIWKDYKDMTSEQALAFEGNLMKTKMALENAFFSIAQASGEPSVIICDRGTMDTSAYLPTESWEVLLDEFGWNLMNLRDRRYDAVIHMVTAAIGAEKYYTTENNHARTETLEEARVLDFKILNAWVGHPQIRIIDNSTDFQGKINRVVQQVCQVVGAPKPANVKRKFLVSTESGDVMIPVKYEQFEVEQTYLVKTGSESKPESSPKPSDPKSDSKTTSKPGFTFIRRRGQNGSYHYSYSENRDLTEGERIVVERQISGREYVALQRQADPNHALVRKKVRCFFYNNQYFQLSTFVEPHSGLTWLETEAEPNAFIEIPSWLKIEKEVTADSGFTSYSVSRQNEKK